MKKNGIIIIAILLLSTNTFAYQSRACDRSCLVNLMQDYLAALVAHNPSAVPFDKEVKFTENTANIPAGDGYFILSFQSLV